jgi:CheY-like chemotaxis protein
VRRPRIEQGTQGGCLGTLVLFPLNDIRRQLSYPDYRCRRKLLREVQNGARVTAGRPKRRPKGGRKPIQRIYSAKAGEAATVVVVDDDPSVLRALSRLIQAAGYKVLTFDRPRALLASAIPRANACMVVDINLPEMNGDALCSALKASGRGLPAVLITGRNDFATQRLIEEAHAVAALFKPIDERVLFDAIAQALALSGTDLRE